MKFVSLGDNIRQHRMKKGLSLHTLSQRSGVSPSMLSQIERGVKNPTVQVACRIAEALNVTLSQLLGEEPRRQTILIPKHRRLVYREEETGIERHVLSPAFPSKGVELVMNVLPEGTDTGVFPPHQPGVTELVYVEEGELEVTLDSATYRLNAGDSLYFEADVPHRFQNVGKGRCRYFLVIDSHTHG